MADTEGPVVSITANEKPPGYPAEILGYVEPWIASPGETVDVKVSIYPYFAVLLFAGAFFVAVD